MVNYASSYHPSRFASGTLRRLASFKISSPHFCRFSRDYIPSSVLEYSSSSSSSSSPSFFVLSISPHLLIFACVLLVCSSEDKTRSTARFTPYFSHLRSRPRKDEPKATLFQPFPSATLHDCKYITKIPSLSRDYVWHSRIITSFSYAGCCCRDLRGFVASSAPWPGCLWSRDLRQGPILPMQSKRNGQRCFR